jgi:hypothetical protein
LWASLNAHIFTYLQGVSLQSLVDDAKERKSPSIHVVKDLRKQPLDGERMNLNTLATSVVNVSA